MAWSPATMTAEHFGRGEDISAFVDPSTVKRPGLAARRVNVDFPEWIIQSLDAESMLIGVSRQALIKLWRWSSSYADSGQEPPHSQVQVARRSY